MSKKVLTNWIGLPEEFTPVGYEGFIYLIVNTLTHQRYVGRKYFWAKTRKKVKGQRRRKKCVKESDWRYYKSSSDLVKSDISRLGLGVFEFHVISLHTSRADTNYAEIREMFLKNVLFSRLSSGEFEYYNSNILGRYFRKKIKDGSSPHSKN